MRFAHLSDCHVGSWREPAMKEINLKYFSYAIDEIIREDKNSKISFVLISGDLFNTAVPSIEALKLVINKLVSLKKSNIRCYGVAGSHDYSASGKSMLSCLEEAGLFIDLMKGEDRQDGFCLTGFLDDSNAMIYGIHGKRGSLEKRTRFFVEETKNSYPKFLAFHSAIEEFLEDDIKNMESIPFKSLPKGFNYYAGGHVHYRFIKETSEGVIAFPGPICPNNFKEWRDLNYGTFLIGNYVDGKIILTEKKIEIHPVKFFSFDLNDLDPISASAKIKDELKDINNSLVLIEASGKLSSGTSSDIRFDQIHSFAMDKGAYWTLRNTSKLNGIEMQTTDIDVKDINEVEDEVIEENISDSYLKDISNNPLSSQKQVEILKSMMRFLSAEKHEGENNRDFEIRVESEFEEFIKNEI